MQLLTGEITNETRNDLAVGTVFRVVKESYGRIETTVVLVNASFYLNLDTPEESLWYEVSLMKMGTTYGPSIDSKTIRSTDEFFTNMQHVEVEEVLAEFARQVNLARQEVLNAEAAVITAKSRSLTFAILADRVGDSI